MRAYFFILFCLLISACASTPVPDIIAVETRPVIKTKSTLIDINAKLEDGKRAYETRDYETSFDAFTQVLLQEKLNNTAWLGRANAALALGLKDEAYEAFTRVNITDLNVSNKRQVLSGLSLITVNAAESNDTEDRLLTALSYTQNDIRLWNALGRYYDQTGQWDKSKDVYVEALKLGVNRDSIINNLGTSLMYQGRYEEARDKFKQALDIAPGTDLYDNNIRLLAALSGNYDEAVSGLTPNRAAIVLNDAGIIAQERGDMETAMRLLTRAIAVSPVYHARAHANLRQIKLVN